MRHLEVPFDDFERQPLLPNKHSQLGPGMAVGDIDGDGDDDFYMGRGRGGRRAVYTNAGGGELRVLDMGPFKGEEVYEDLGVLFFDADRDGDQDLFAVSGGVEGRPGDPVFAIACISTMVRVASPRPRRGLCPRFSTAAVRWWRRILIAMEIWISLSVAGWCREPIPRRR